MKILFYVEPHGIRDSFTAHKMPYNRFRDIAREINFSGKPQFDEVEARVFSNHFVSTADFDANYSDWPFILQPTTDEQTMIESQARLWMGEGLNDWISLMTDPEATITKSYVSLLERIKREEYNYDVIVCWGESMPAREAARKLGAKIVFFELASMRAPFLNSVLIDPVGVNGMASVAHMDISHIKSILSPLPLRLLPLLQNEEFARGVQNTVLPNALFHPLSQNVRAFLDRPGRKAFVPLQLADDANQLLYSKYRTVEEFASAAIEPLLRAGFGVIIKPHPHAKMRGGFVMREQKKILQKYMKYSEVLVLSEDDGQEEYLPMLKAVDLVVTNNSSAGFEALMLETPVVVMGQACYAPQSGLPTISEAIRCFVDQELDQAFLENRRYIASYMLACAFPLARRLGEELVKRLQLWNQFSDPSGLEWLDSMMETCAWDTWHNKDFLRKSTAIA
ncbi:hypothetical protein [Limimaricola sp. AA108-03]|uniref:capsular polysaccharide export protein, LipB/KpsS family n=1 Tax=Limimaricola sp. AA108-03 TaxID=3425945 RepID=UPI003D77606B